MIEFTVAMLVASFLISIAALLRDNRDDKVRQQLKWVLEDLGYEVALDFIDESPTFRVFHGTNQSHAALKRNLTEVKERVDALYRKEHLVYKAASEAVVKTPATVVRARR